MSRNPWVFVGLLLLAAVLGAGAALGVQGLVSGGLGDKPRIERIVRDYVLEHPEILPQAMDRLRTRETAQVIDANKSAIISPFPGAVSGNPNGDVTLVAFMDYACGYCRANLPALRQLIRDDPKLRVVYREFPILSEESVTAARWALAAARQGKYQAFHDLLFAGSTLSNQSIQAAARGAGLDMVAAAQVAGSESVEQELNRNHQLARQLNITGTPGWVVGHQIFPGATSYEALRDAVKAARQG